ncbi:hypothetical protein BGZ60DRAFT_395892 [Tricladium varicosporioides]|nr:hypothetical protein BGZ60DRAFT_395892 [Hymenoscyphus varicosporioides]
MNIYLSLTCISPHQMLIAISSFRSKMSHKTLPVRPKTLATRPSNPQTSLNGLPAEIRLKIFKYILPSEFLETSNKTPNVTHDPTRLNRGDLIRDIPDCRFHFPTGILRTNRKINREFCDLLYGSYFHIMKIWFSFEIDFLGQRIPTPISFPGIFQHVQKLEIWLDFPQIRVESIPVLKMQQHLATLARFLSSDSSSVKFLRVMLTVKDPWSYFTLQENMSSGNVLKYTLGPLQEVKNLTGADLELHLLDRIWERVQTAEEYRIANRHFLLPCWYAWKEFMDNVKGKRDWNDKIWVVWKQTECYVNENGVSPLVRFKDCELDPPEEDSHIFMIE